MPQTRSRYLAKQQEKKEKEEKDYKSWLKTNHKKDSVSSREENATLREYTTKFEEARHAITTGCYWNSGDWAPIREIQLKQFIQYMKKANGKAFKSSFKSPATLGRIQSTLGKFKSMQLRFGAHPNDAEDAGKAEVAQIILDYIFRTGLMKKSIYDWVLGLMVHGSFVARLVYIKQFKDLSYPATDIYNLSEKDKKKAEKEVVWKPKERVLVFKGLVIQIVPLEEAFPDPQALDTHGMDRACRYFFWRRQRPLEAAKAELLQIPGAKKSRIESLKGAGYFEEEEYKTPYLTSYKQPLSEDMAEIVECEDIEHDRYVVICNNRVVVDTPMQTPDKELSLYKADCVRVPGQFWGMGFGDMLRPSQTAEELLVNLAYDYMFRSINIRYLVDKNMMGAATKTYAQTDSVFIPVDTNDANKPLTAYMAPLQHQPISFDFYRLLDVTEKMQTKATQVDPTQMALNQGGRTATSWALNKETQESMIASLADNVADVLGLMGQQAWAYVPKAFSKEEQQKITGDADVNQLRKDYSKITLPGLKVSVDTQDNVRVETTDEKYTTFEVSSKVVQTKQPLDIYIIPESLEVITAGFEAGQAREQYAQLLANAVDPTDPQQMANPQILKLYNAIEISQWYVKKNRLPEKFLLNPEVSKRREMEEAQSNLALLDKDEDILARPGRSKEYIEYMATALQGLTQRSQELYDAIQEELANTPPTEPQIDPMTGQVTQPPIEPNPALQEEYDRVRSAELALAHHIEVSQLPSYMMGMAALQESAQQGEPAQPPPPPGMDGNMLPAQPGAPVMMPQGMQAMSDVVPGFGGAM